MHKSILASVTFVVVVAFALSGQAGQQLVTPVVAPPAVVVMAPPVVVAAPPTIIYYPVVPTLTYGRIGIFGWRKGWKPGWTLGPPIQYHLTY